MIELYLDEYRIAIFYYDLRETEDVFEILRGAVADYASDYFVMVAECLVPMVIDVLKPNPCCPVARRPP